MKAILTVGLPASGKTTWAKQYVRDNPGTIRFNNDEFSYMTTGWDDGRSFEPMDSSYLRLMRREAIKAAVFRDVDIVLDNTNLSLDAVLEADGFAPVERVYFKADYATCISRNNARGNPIPNRVIASMAERYSSFYEWINYGNW